MKNKIKKLLPEILIFALFSILIWPLLLFVGQIIVDNGLQEFIEYLPRDYKFIFGELFDGPLSVLSLFFIFLSSYGTYFFYYKDQKVSLTKTFFDIPLHLRSNLHHKNRPILRKEYWRWSRLHCLKSLCFTIKRMAWRLQYFNSNSIKLTKVSNQQWKFRKL